MLRTNEEWLNVRKKNYNPDNNILTIVKPRQNEKNVVVYEIQIENEM